MVGGLVGLLCPGAYPQGVGPEVGLSVPVAGGLVGLLCPGAYRVGPEVGLSVLVVGGLVGLFFRLSVSNSCDGRLDSAVGGLVGRLFPFA